MSDSRSTANLFKLPKTTAEAMRTNMKQLDDLLSVKDKLKAVGLFDAKTEKQMMDLKKLTESILTNFDIE